MQRECKLDLNVDEYVESTVRPYLMDVIYCWSKVSSVELLLQKSVPCLAVCNVCMIGFAYLLHRLNIWFHQLFSRFMSSVNFESVCIMFEQNLGEEKKYMELFLGWQRADREYNLISQAGHAQVWC